MRIRLLGTSDSDTELWDAFVAASSDGHILQSSRWGQFKAAFDWQVARVIVEDGGRLVAGAQVLFRPLLRWGTRPLGPTVAYIPKGPIVDWADSQAAGALLEAVHRLSCQRRAILLKIEPDLINDPTTVERLKGHSFRPSSQSVQPRSTILIDLTADAETLLTGMKSKTRYNVRLAERRGVKVREGTADDLEVFYHLLQITSRRDGFALHSREYYNEVYCHFAPAGLAVLLLAVYQGRILAGLMAFAFGRKAWYFYGASSDEERQRMPNHLLQWKAIHWAKARGCLTYDMWGIPDEVGRAPQLYQRTQARTDGLWGVYRFKQGFGGEVVRYVGAYDYVYSPVLYRLYNKAVAWRRSMG